MGTTEPKQAPSQYLSHGLHVCVLFYSFQVEKYYQNFVDITALHFETVHINEMRKSHLFSLNELIHVFYCLGHVSAVNICASNILFCRIEEGGLFLLMY